MQKKTFAGVALFCTIATLLMFSCIAFLGAEYLLHGSHQKAIPITMAGMALIIYCVSVMCRSKKSRNKRSGLPREVAAFIIAIVLLVIGSIPFTQFIYVHNHQEELRDCMVQTANAVNNIDSLYKEYAEARVRRYKSHLYKNHFSSEATRQRVESLRRRLIPEDFDAIHTERQQWLSTLSSADVWNISTPHNLHYLIKAGHDWTEQYAKVSKVVYQGEKAEPFGSGDTAFTAIDAGEQFSQFQKPDILSVLAVLLAIGLILTTYLHLRRPKNKYVGDHR